ncbi:MAG: hypothetical protein U1E76_27455 [Planctomycetota bacterium]
MRRLLINTMAGAFVLAAASPLFAGGREPSSVLVYPVFDSRQALTIISIVNSNGDHSWDPSRGDEKGSVWVHFNYINGDGCRNNDASVHLTPNDTFQTLASAHSPSAVEGYLYVYAETDNHSGIAKSWNYLIGDLLAIDGVLNIEYSANAYGFRSPLKDNELTDLDGDKALDFDGLEYEKLPDVLLFPHFFGQNDREDRGNGIDGCIAMLGLTGSRYTYEVDFDIYNDNEYHSSAYGYPFTCWAFPKLVDISGAFTETYLDSLGSNDDPNELYGFPEINTGWFSLRGNIAYHDNSDVQNPGILALYVERIGKLSAADLPWCQGTRTGALLPRTN